MPSMARRFDVTNWYWIVANDETKIYSSSQANYVEPTAEAYVAWVALGNRPTRILNESELWEVLSVRFPQGIMKV